MPQYLRQERPYSFYVVGRRQSSPRFPSAYRCGGEPDEFSEVPLRKPETCPPRFKFLIDRPTAFIRNEPGRGKEDRDCADAEFEDPDRRSSSLDWQWGLSGLGFRFPARERFVAQVAERCSEREDSLSADGIWSGFASFPPGQRAFIYVHH